MATRGISLVFLEEKIIKDRDLRKDGVKLHVSCGNFSNKEKELPLLINLLGKSPFNLSYY